MTFRVGVKREAWSEAFANADWWATYRSREQAERWLHGLMSAIDDLKTTAPRHAPAAESDRFPFDLRQMNYGLGAKPTHRVLYEIRGDEVRV